MQVSEDRVVASVGAIQEVQLPSALPTHYTANANVPVVMIAMLQP